jgi:hypothetical protein
MRKVDHLTLNEKGRSCIGYLNENVRRSCIDYLNEDRLCIDYSNIKTEHASTS